MSTAFIVCDPVSSRTSVQYGLVNMAIRSLGKKYKIIVISPYISRDKSAMFEQDPQVTVISLSQRKKFLGAFYRMLETNEAMLWSLSWLLEVLFKANSSLYLDMVKGKENAVVVNLAYTMPVASGLYWNQATPPLKTLKMMGSNPLAPFMTATLGRLIEMLDRGLRSRHLRLSNKIANNSLYLKELHRGHELFSDTVIHVPKDFGTSKVPETTPTRDYVLAYIGKEVETDTLIEVASLGVRMIAFGAKIPFGTPLGKLKELIDFRGYVNDEELSVLYHNALFTVFPFTEEPFGWVPLESMFYGTPVLSYDKQGPSETILDNRTGWLMKTREDFIKKAVEIWTSRTTGIQSSDCKERARFFSLERTSGELATILGSVDE